MSEGLIEYGQRLAWSHTSSVIAKLHNVNCQKKGSMISADDVNPFVKLDEANKWQAILERRKREREPSRD